MLLAILGPTASGKSALAVEVARRTGGTVVNGDPFQALEGLSIGTGQSSAQEQGGVPHIGYGVLPLSARPNPASFGKQVRTWLAEVSNPVLVTGSGLYLRGIWNQLTGLPDAEEALARRVRRWAEALGAPRLHRVLAAVDPARAAELHPRDGSRVTRALALHLATGRKPSHLLTGIQRGIPEGWRALVVEPSRDAQRRRIERRVADQVAAGWREETQELLAKGHGEDLAALRPLGYSAWAAGGEVADIQARIIQETQRYAKRQATWFRHQLPEAPRWDPDAEPLSAALQKLGLP